MLFERVSRRSNRPLLKTGDPKEILAGLMEQRYPIYRQADLHVRTGRAAIETTVENVYDAVCTYLTSSQTKASCGQSVNNQEQDGKA